MLDRKDFTIQKLSDFGQESEQLVLCYKGEVIPFQTRTEYFSSGNIPGSSHFVVTFECIKSTVHNPDTLMIRKHGCK